MTTDIDFVGSICLAFAAAMIVAFVAGTIAQWIVGTPQDFFAGWMASAAFYATRKAISK